MSHFGYLSTFLLIWIDLMQYRIDYVSGVYCTLRYAISYCVLLFSPRVCFAFFFWGVKLYLWRIIKKITKIYDNCKERDVICKFAPVVIPTISYRHWLSEQKAANERDKRRLIYDKIILLYFCVQVFYYFQETISRILIKNSFLLQFCSI